jgi:hypothetical protein
MKRIAMMLLGAILMLPACNRDGDPQSLSGPASSPGWEVRYNATLALAHRGSDKVKDERTWELLREMLDEDQQLRNFRRKQKDGKEVIDEGPARLTVITALQAVHELHKKRPELDLSGLNDRIESLTKSRNVAVSTEAKKVQQSLSK